MNHLNQNPWIPSWSAALEFTIFSCVTFGESGCISTTAPRQFLAIHFACCLTIQKSLLCCFCSSRKFLLPLHAFVPFAFYFLHWLVGRISFRYFRISCLVCIVGSCSDIFWVSIPSTIFFCFISSKANIFCLIFISIYFNFLFFAMVNKKKSIS